MRPEEQWCQQGPKSWFCSKASPWGPQLRHRMGTPGALPDSAPPLPCGREMGGLPFPQPTGLSSPTHSSQRPGLLAEGDASPERNLNAAQHRHADAQRLAPAREPVGSVLQRGARQVQEGVEENELRREQSGEGWAKGEGPPHGCPGSSPQDLLGQGDCRAPAWPTSNIAGVTMAQQVLK